jgi:WD40 repeat protein
MTLDYTLHHHVSAVNTVTLSPDGERLLSGGKVKYLPSDNFSLDCAGNDADVVIWNNLTGEKVQVITCAFHGPIGALTWISKLPGLAPGFVFSCADRSIHVY